MEIRESDNRAVAADFVASLKQGDGATVLGFRGDLGAGKTTFTKAVAAALGVTDTITSPTFVIMKHYETAHPQFAKLTHIDAYRLENGDDLRPLKFSELLHDKDRLIIIEWPEKVADALPANIRFIDFNVATEDTRKITGLTHG